MEYLYYIGAVLFIGLVCAVSIRVLTGNSKARSKLSPEGKRRALAAANSATGNNHKNKRQRGKEHTAIPAIEREIQRTPTPWGWPNHRQFNEKDDTKSGWPGAVQSFTRRLVQKKQLAETRSSDPRINGSLRALLQDRYGPVNKEIMAEFEFAEVKRPLLRDPTEPPDQMDNFGTREAEKVRAKLDRINARKPEASASQSGKNMRYVAIKDVKQPWGW